MNEMIHAETKLGDCRTVHTEGDFVITKDTTVTQVESGFQEKFGVAVQVFRKSSAVWLETSATDSWTLQEQNEQGAFMEQKIGE